MVADRDEDADGISPSAGGRSPRHLDATYGRAWQRFLVAADTAGAHVTSSVHPLVGREDEELAIDVVGIGSADADTVAMIVSGTHGVEGYARSALQTWWLDELSASVPTSVR